MHILSRNLRPFIDRAPGEKALPLVSTHAFMIEESASIHRSCTWRESIAAGEHTRVHVQATSSGAGPARTCALPDAGARCRRCRLRTRSLANEGALAVLLLLLLLLFAYRDDALSE